VGVQQEPRPETQAEVSKLTTRYRLWRYLYRRGLRTRPPHIVFRTPPPEPSPQARSAGDSVTTGTLIGVSIAAPSWWVSLLPGLIISAVCLVVLFYVLGVSRSRG
jgi:hypothetical protein